MAALIVRTVAGGLAACLLGFNGQPVGCTDALSVCT